MTSQTTSDLQRGHGPTAKGRMTTQGAAALVCSFGMMVLGAGCSDDEAPASTGAHAGYAAPVHQEVPQSLWSLADVEMHEKVQFPEQVTPRSREVADAVASFASALASGNNVALLSLLDQRDRAVLREMVDHGDWDRYTQGVDGVRVSVLLEEVEGFRLGLGVMSERVAYLTGWEAKASDGVWTFTGLHVQRIEAERLALLDGASLDPPVLDEVIAAADLAPTVPAEEEPPEDGAAPPGGGIGTGGGDLGRPSDF